MSDLTITPNSTTVGGSGTPNQPTPTQAKPAPSAPASSTDVADSIELSGIAQNNAPSEKPALSESDAQSQAAKLRQQLNSVSLSGTARQNQAIVSLLR